MTTVDDHGCFCPVCNNFAAEFAPGPGGRPDARCPRCQSLERHRFLGLFLEAMAPVISSARGLLDVAPSGHMTSLLQRLAPQQYVRIDLDPAADKRSVDLQASLTQLPFRDASFDVVICYHVLEHVPDDAAAIAELRRVLRPGAMAVVQVPWRSDAKTDEDPSATEAERVARFGQADHVRYYGVDFDDRLRDGGLDSFRFLPQDILSDRLCRLMRLNPVEPVWMLRPADGSAATGTDATLRNRTLDTFAHELASARGEAARYRARYERLRGMPAMRAAAWMSRPFRR